MFKAKEAAEELVNCMKYSNKNYINIKGNKNSLVWVKSSLDKEGDDYKMMKSQYPKGYSELLENSREELNELSNNFDKEEILNINRFKLKVGGVILGISSILTIIFKLNHDNFIISMGIQAYNFVKNSLFFIDGISGGFIGVNLYKRFKLTKLPDKTKKVEVSKPSLKEKDISRENIINILGELRSTWVKGDEEQKQSVKYFAIAQEQIKQIVTVQDTLKTLTNSKEEESLSEVFNTLSKVENQMLRNIYGMLNHIYLECSIDGYDTTNIEEYLEANEKMIEESSRLLKASLLYMDGKSGSKGIDEYIKSMVETLKKLKKDV